MTAHTCDYYLVRLVKGREVFLGVIHATPKQVLRAFKRARIEPDGRVVVFTKH